MSSSPVEAEQDVVMEAPSTRQRSPEYVPHRTGDTKRGDRSRRRSASKKSRRESRRRRDRSSSPRRRNDDRHTHRTKHDAHPRDSSRRRRRTPSPHRSRDDHGTTSPPRWRRRNHSPVRPDSPTRPPAAGATQAVLVSSDKVHQGHSDWICGICQSPNFSRRNECFKCSAPYDPVVSRDVAPCDELIVRGIPPDVTEQKLTNILLGTVPSSQVVAIRHVRIVRGDSSSGSNAFGFVLFGSVAEAQLVLNTTRGKHVLPNNTVLRLSYSLRGATTSTGPLTGAEHVEKWEPPSFATSEEKRNYLLDLYKRWSDISADEKKYYDSNVDLLLADAAGSTTSLRSTTTGLVLVESAGGASADEHPPADSLSALKKKLELRRIEVEKKKAAEAAAVAAAANISATPESSCAVPVAGESSSPKSARTLTAAVEVSSPSSGAPGGSSTSSAQTLLQRLAEKKKAAAAAASSNALAAVAPAVASAPLPQVLFGFPTPPHFPVKQEFHDGIAISRPNLRSYIALKYIPERIAERILADRGGLPAPAPPVLPTPALRDDLATF